MQIAVLGRVRLYVRNARDSLWFIPAVLVAVASALALVLLRLDTHLDRTGDPTWWLFAGNAESARTILSVVAGSLITVVAVAFSVTVIAIQQASTQYSPRILRNFTRDRGNQFVLGAYIATFVFALLVLRRVREDTAELAGFIPAISITSAVVLALISFGLLVYFIHHVTRSLQVSVLLATIAREVCREFEHQFPKRVGQAREPSRSEVVAMQSNGQNRHACPIHNSRSGYIQIIDAGAIERIALRNPIEAVVFVAIGDFVQDRELVACVFSEQPLGEGVVDTLRAAFSTDDTRTIELDPMFGIRQMVDIALKALSPGVNDPSTAMQALDHLGNAMASLLDRELPSPERSIGPSRVVFRVPSFDDYFEASFAGIRHAARGDRQVTRHLVHVLDKLARRTTERTPVRGLSHQLDEIVAGTSWDVFTPHEQRALRALVDDVAGRLEPSALDRGAVPSGHR